MFTFSPFANGKNLLDATAINVGVKVIKASDMVANGGLEAKIRDEHVKTSLHPLFLNILQKSVERRQHDESLGSSLYKQYVLVDEQVLELIQLQRKAHHMYPAEISQGWLKFKDSFLISALQRCDEFKTSKNKVSQFMVKFGLDKEDIFDNAYGVDYDSYQVMATSFIAIVDRVVSEISKGNKSETRKNHIDKFLNRFEYFLRIKQLVRQL